MLAYFSNMKMEAVNRLESHMGEKNAQFFWERQEE
jgi:hypothetical protein